MTPTPEQLASRRAAFAALHEKDCFVLPNPWDVGSAVFLRHLGFRALATTSAGFLFTMGRPDTVDGCGVDEVLAHTALIVGATDLPVNADFQAGYAEDASGVATNVARCVEAGVAGLSIEDATGDPERPLYELPEAVDRLTAAREAIDASGAQVLLTGRAESFLVGHPRALEDAIERLVAYAELGADVLYAPGVRTLDAFGAIVRAVAPKPVNGLVSGDLGLSVPELAHVGVRRISVGSALARAAWGGFLRSAREIADTGRFSSFADAASFDELNGLFGG